MSDLCRVVGLCWLSSHSLHATIEHATVYAYTSRFMHNYASVIMGAWIEKMQLDSEISILGIVNAENREIGEIKMK